MLLTKANTTETGVRKHTLAREIKVGPISLQFITVIILALLALFYLAQSTQSATRNYKARELDDQRASLEKDNQRLQIEVVRLESLNEIKNSVQSLNLEPSQGADFIPASGTQSARR